MCTVFWFLNSWLLSYETFVRIFSHVWSSVTLLIFSFFITRITQASLLPLVSLLSVAINSGSPSWIVMRNACVQVKQFYIWLIVIPFPFLPFFLLFLFLFLFVFAVFFCFFFAFVLPCLCPFLSNLVFTDVIDCISNNASFHRTIHDHIQSCHL